MQQPHQHSPSPYQVRDAVQGRPSLPLGTSDHSGCLGLWQRKAGRLWSLGWHLTHPGEGWEGFLEEVHPNKTEGIGQNGWLGGGWSACVRGAVRGWQTQDHTTSVPFQTLLSAMTCHPRRTMTHFSETISKCTCGPPASRQHSWALSTRLFPSLLCPVQGSPWVTHRARRELFLSWVHGGGREIGQWPLREFRPRPAGRQAWR